MKYAPRLGRTGRLVERIDFSCIEKGKALGVGDAGTVVIIDQETWKLFNMIRF